MVDPAGHKDSSDMEQTLNKSASCELKLCSIIHEGLTTMLQRVTVCGESNYRERTTTGPIWAEFLRATEAQKAA